MRLLFAITLFVSAALVFCVQPMICKMVLPLLGGSPAVWNTCAVFFQAALLAGYAYAHWTTKWLGARRQSWLHFAILLPPLLCLPIALSRSDSVLPVPQEANPIPWLLLTLALSVGLPFFAVSTTGPLLQRWFAETSNLAARDPYSLYAASNLGSMIALAAYPFLIEPSLTLRQQSDAWSFGYGAFAVLTLFCAVVLWKSPAAPATPAEACPDDEKLTWRRRLRWLGLALIPSSLMLGTTTYLSTDIAAIPLLWVVPLALYLLTFILAFSRRRIMSAAFAGRWLPLGVVVVTFLLQIPDMQPPLWVLIPLHLGVFFLAAMMCHGNLAEDRPAVRHLTEFYLWLAAGGVLGGACNALVAPILFKNVVEYPLVLTLACLFRRPVGKPSPSPIQKKLDWRLPLLAGAVTVALVVGMQHGPLADENLRRGLTFAPPLVLCYTFLARPFRFFLGVAAVWAAGSLAEGMHGQLLYTERSFFAVSRVTKKTEPGTKSSDFQPQTYHVLVHGNTEHGRQSLEPARREEPLAYYHRTGPVGDVFRVFRDREKQSQPLPPVGVIGLGAGAMACYAEPGQTFVYYEIDPAVQRIAENENYFTFLEAARDRGANLKVVLGDARLRLHEAPPGYYGLLIFDAFSSDAVPVHLINREALKLYLQKLAEHGLLAFQISNRYLDLRPVLAALARDAGLACGFRADVELAPEELENGKQPSIWFVMARQPRDLVGLLHLFGWQPCADEKPVPVWTDDYSNLLRSLRRE